MATIKGTKGNDSIIGSKRDDTIKAGDGNDVVHAGLGRDFVEGGSGNDQLYGEAGNDVLFGMTGDDVLVGGDGDDHLLGGAGSNTLSGGSGNDMLDTLQGTDTASGGDGDDLFYFIGDDTVTGGSGHDVFTFVDHPGSVGTINDYTVGEDILGYRAGGDANAALAGTQGWEYIGDAPPLSPLTNGNGQATVSYDTGYTILQLFHADGDVSADVTVRLLGTFAAEDLVLMNYNSISNAWTDPGLLFP